jgi:anti-sigma factor ChrR (cupin superfamily)
MKKHPSPDQLALHAGGDLPLAARLRLAWHLRVCPRCAAEVRRLAECRSLLARGANELPAGLDWQRLALEMRANIRLGLAAGAALHRPLPAAAPSGSGWRLAVVLSSVAFVAAAGWLLRAPQPELSMPSAAIHAQAPATQVVLDAQPGGLAVRESGAELTLLGPATQPLTTAVSWDLSARARFLDAETGQVTIYNVSAQ